MENTSTKALVQEILSEEKQLLTSSYFKLQKLFEEKYGENTVVLMEIGTFFEVYEINNEDEQVGKAKEIAQLLNIQLTRKNKNIIENSEENPLMAGVPSVSLEKHLSKIISEEKYTIVLSLLNECVIYSALSDWRTNRVPMFTFIAPTLF